MSLKYKCVRCNNMAPCVLTIDTSVLDAPDNCPYGFDFFNWISAAESAEPVAQSITSGNTPKTSPQGEIAACANRLCSYEYTDDKNGNLVREVEQRLRRLLLPE